MTTSPTAPTPSGDDRVVRTGQLDRAEVDAVRALAQVVAEHDGVAALSEAFDLALDAESTHLLSRRGDRLAGYAGVAPDAAAEVLVHPDERRRGVGRALVTAARDHGAQRFWAHGDRPAARALAATSALVRTRELHRMERPLTLADREPPALPKGLAVVSYAEHPSVEALQRVNAAAFAEHPEQGRLTVADLRGRMALPWFDPAGLLWLVDETSDPSADPVGFHWTKVDPPGHGVGETYVVGVHPAYQGRGLARPLTRLGLSHLAARGLSTVELYVDGTNTVALTTYAREGFTIAATDVMYAVVPVDD